MTDAEISFKQEIVFVRILIPFCLGIFSFYACRVDGILYQLILVNSILFIHLILKSNDYKKLEKQRNNGVNGVVLHLLFFSIGALSSTLYKYNNNTDYKLINKNNYLKIRIIDEPKNRQNIILFTARIVKLEAINHYISTKYNNKYSFNPASGKLNVILLKDATIPLALKYGDELIIPAKFTETKPRLNPSEFDYKSWLATQNIYHETFLKQVEVVKLKANTTSHNLTSFALQLRERQVSIYRRLIKDDDAFAVAATLILGYRADLSADILDIYSKTGTIHALSVSGMHVGLLYLILTRLLWFLNGKQANRIIKTLFILTGIWFYALLTGLSPSVLRAALMISAFIIAKLFAKNINSYNIVAFAAFCILLYNPFFIWDVGFQLSFMAVLGLIYLQPKIEQCLIIKPFLLRKLWSIIAMSLAAQLATYPFSVYYFHQFPIYFLLSNLFITIPTALIMYIGIVILVFRLDELGPLFEWLITFTNAGLEQIAQLPFSGITSIWLNKIELCLLSFALILLIMALAQFKKPLIFYATILFLLLQCFITHDKLQALHQKKIIRFTLPKNYAIAILSAHRAILFTNLKPESKTFNYSVRPALDQHGITQITFKTVNVSRF